MKSIQRYIPFALGCMLLWDVVVYFGARLFYAGRTFYCFSFQADELLPFIPAFIVIYLGAYAQWAIGYLCIAADSRDLCYRMAASEMTAKTICLLFYILLPTTLVRPEVTGRDIFSRLVALIYQVDAPNNLLPSIHCLESWFCMRYAWQTKKLPRRYPWVMTVFSALVFASTLFVKQHLIVDVLGAVLVAELGILISRKLHLDRAFFSVDRRFSITK